MANEEHLNILKQGVAVWNAWRLNIGGFSNWKEGPQRLSAGVRAAPAGFEGGGVEFVEFMEFIEWGE